MDNPVSRLPALKRAIKIRKSGLRNYLNIVKTMS
jgi:hypothetical protein